MADIISDVNAERIGRVYGVQYLASFYARKAGESDEWSQTEEAEKARVSFFSALLDADTLLQGTALISLTELTAARPEIDRTALTDKALHSVRSSDTSPTVRAASFQYCARFKIPMALEAARIWAEKTDEVFVSMSALYLIGEIGTNEDARKVRHWMNQPRQKAKRRAMEIALAKIERRQKDSHKTDLMEENDDGLHQR
ncbi:MAG: hypothetical protein U1E27_11680 [Kiritimatiellia bacterium]|nr:hypothetical protein [Kiritimatiellia bacterium]